MKIRNGAGTSDPVLSMDTNVALTLDCLALLTKLGTVHGRLCVNDLGRLTIDGVFRVATGQTLQ